MLHSDDYPWVSCDANAVKCYVWLHACCLPCEWCFSYALVNFAHLTLSEENAGADLGGECRGCTPPLPRDDLRFSRTTGILPKKKLCGLLVLK